MLDPNNKEESQVENSNSLKTTTDKNTTTPLTDKTNSSEEVKNDKKNVVDNEVVMESYETFSMEELTDAIKKLIENEPIQKIKKNVDAIKINFDKKFITFIEAKKEAFVAEGGNPIDFHFKSDLKYAFNGFVNEYRKKIKQHYKQLEDQRKENLTKKTNIIESIKALVTNSEQGTLYKDFQALRELFFKIGAVPREHNENIWQTYRFYEQQIYDILHLNSDFRNLDFKHNLEEKTKIADRAEVLAKEPDSNKAFKELQILHRLWKEEIGPVAREFREEIWERFKAATKEINDKRQEFYNALEAKWEENVPKKQAVVDKIKTLVDREVTTHSEWQNKIKEMQSLREEFFNVGKVPKEKGDIIWNELREITRSFNKYKNAFYKDVKNVHQENLDKKRALIEKANALKDSEDFETTSNTLKKLQAEWKTVGHVPRKFSDKLWNEFRGACNHFFERLHAKQDEGNKVLMEVFEKKKVYLANLKEGLTEETKTSLDEVKKYINEWKTFGTVPQNMRFIEAKFNKVIDKMFSKLDLDKKEMAMMRFKNNISSLLEENNARKIENEAYFIRKKIDEITKEVKLLENNLGFFSNASSDNPMVKNVYKNIEKQNDDLSLWKQKLTYLRSVLN